MAQSRHAGPTCARWPGPKALEESQHREKQGSGPAPRRPSRDDTVHIRHRQSHSIVVPVCCSEAYEVRDIREDVKNTELFQDSLNMQNNL